MNETTEDKTEWTEIVCFYDTANLVAYDYIQQKVKEKWMFGMIMNECF